MPITIDQAREVKRAARDELKARLPVVGIGLTRQGEDYAVKVNLSHAAAGEELPASWEGVPLVFEVVGPITPR